MTTTVLKRTDVAIFLPEKNNRFVKDGAGKGGLIHFMIPGSNIPGIAYKHVFGSSILFR